MTVVALPSACNCEGLLTALAAAGCLSGSDEPILFHLPSKAFLRCSALSLLCVWARREIRRGRRVTLRGDDGHVRYLARLDLQEHLGLEYEKRKRRLEVGRFLPLRLIERHEDLRPVLDAICDLVLHQVEQGRSCLPAIEWIASELLENILIHSESEHPGAIAAQYFPRKHRLDIGVADVGRGIYASLSESVPVWSHGDAVSKAIQRGVTRDEDVGQGNGLAGAVEIVRVNGGDLELWSGDAHYRCAGGVEKGFTEIPEAPGTGVMVSIDTRRPVHLEETWIAGVAGDSGFLRATVARLEGGQSLAVVQECRDTATRQAAAGLRRKVLALLPEVSHGIEIDFAGVERASSSFLDELLGRAAAELGEERFRDRLQIRGISEGLRRQAEVVIQQRVRGLPPEETDA